MKITLTVADAPEYANVTYQVQKLAKAARALCIPADDVTVSGPPHSPAVATVASHHPNAGRLLDHLYASEDEVVEAGDRIERRRYWDGVRLTAAEAVRQFPRKDADADDRDQYIHEDVDGDAYIIYTYKNLAVMRFTDNDDAYLELGELTGEGSGEILQQMAFYAMKADVVKEIDNIGLIDDDEATDEQKAEAAEQADQFLAAHPDATAGEIEDAIGDIAITLAVADERAAILDSLTDHCQDAIDAAPADADEDEDDAE